MNSDKKHKSLERFKEQLKKLELQETDRDENKTIALGTSKLNYLDPRISVAWLVCLSLILYLVYLLFLFSPRALPSVFPSRTISEGMSCVRFQFVELPVLPNFLRYFISSI